MRLPAVILAAALAACRVDVEGAICAVPGDASECPSGQACGTDLRCSARAASCTPCTEGTIVCLSGDVKRCTGALDGACGGWIVEGESCTARGYVCGTRSGSPACECPANVSSAIAADPQGSADPDAFPYPSGLESPAACRFGSLTHALAAAKARDGGVIVQVYGAGSTIVFGAAATGESFPLEIAPNVTVVGAAAPAGPTVVRGDGSGGAASSSIVALQGAIEKVSIENVSMTGRGLECSCGASGAPLAREVVVSSGAPQLAAAVTVSGACGATLERVDASGAIGAALDVAAADGAAVVVAGGRFHHSGRGVRATGGVVDVRPQGGTSAEVTDNVADGVTLEGASRIVATLHRVVVARNGGTGVVVANVSSTSELEITESEILANGGAVARSYGPGSPQRKVGGILLSQASLASFTYLRNRVYANAEDQLAIESSGSWSIVGGTTECGPAVNAFGCVGPGKFGASVSGGGTLDASFSVWPATPPGPYASAGVTVAPYCTGAAGAPPAPACP